MAYTVLNSERTVAGNSGVTRETDEGWKTGKHYRLRIAVYKDEDDAICASALNVGGVHDFGKTETEAVTRIADTVSEMLKKNKGTGEEFPWQDADEALARLGYDVVREHRLFVSENA